MCRPGGAPWLSWPPLSFDSMSPITAPDQKAPSVATVTAMAQGPTINSTRTAPQVQPRSFSQGARRSQIHRAAMARNTTIGPIGPLIRIDRARLSQNSALVPLPAIASPLLAA